MGLVGASVGVLRSYVGEILRRLTDRVISRAANCIRIFEYFKIRR